MRISVGSDHRGHSVKSKVVELLVKAGHEVLDEGTNSTESVDYPDFGALVGKKVSNGEVERGILICGTGIGMTITANKFPHVRAATCNDEITAEMCRRHNDVNILCLSSDMLGERNIEPLIRIWLETEFDGGRHARRIGKISDLERSNGLSS